MVIKVIDPMINIASRLGTVTKINMYNENCIYICGKTEDGKEFNLDLRIAEEEENDTL